MSSFQYEAYHNAEQRKVHGTIEAGDLGEARRLLMQQDLVPLHLQAAVGGETPPDAEPQALDGPAGWLLSRAVKPRHADLAAFTRSMATMLGAGLPLTAALQNQHRHARSAAFRRLALQLHRDIAAGMRFGEALARYPAHFDRVYVRLVDAGEYSGQLEAVLNRLAELLRRQDGVHKRLREIMMYPLFTLIVWLGVGLIFSAGVIPLAVKGLTEAHLRVPPLLQAVMPLRWVWPLALLGGALGLGSLYGRLVARGPGKAFRDALLWPLPRVGPLIDLTACEQFITTLRLALASGVVITEATELAAESVGHTQSRQAYRAVLPVVRQGRSLVEGLAEVPHVPDVVMQILAAGEEAGALEKVMTAAEVYLKDEIAHALEGVLKLCHFLSMLLSALCVAVFLALFYGVLFGGIFGSIAEQVSRQIPAGP